MLALRLNTQRTELVGPVRVGNKEYVVRLTRTIPAHAPPSILSDSFRMSWGSYKPGVQILGERTGNEAGANVAASEQVTKWKIMGRFGLEGGSHSDMTAFGRQDQGLFYRRLPFDKAGHDERVKIKEAVLSGFEGYWDGIYDSLCPANLRRNMYFALEKMQQMERPAMPGWLNEEFGKKLPLAEIRRTCRN